MVCALLIHEFNAHQARLVKKSVDGLLQPRKIAAQFPRAVGVGCIVQDDEEAIGDVEPPLG